MGILMSPAMAGRHEGLRSVRRRLPRGAATVPLVLCLVGVTATLANAIHAIGSDTHILRGAIIPDRQSPAIAQEYREAVEDHPFNLQARSGLTLAYLDAGRWTDALNSSEELKALSPRYPKNHLMRAYALFRLSRPREALRDIGMELKERSHPESYMIEAAVFRSLADTQGERNALTNLLRSDIRGGIPYGVQSSIARLTELCTTGAERGEAASLFDSLAVRFDLRPPPGLKHRDGD
jgi:tetratricopeptide (TPR) repeat protein